MTKRAGTRGVCGIEGVGVGGIEEEEGEGVGLMMALMSS